MTELRAVLQVHQDPLAAAHAAALLQEAGEPVSFALQLGIG